MKNETRVEFRPDSADLVNFIIKHFRTFVITGLVAGVVTAGISLLIKPLYESVVILYPSSNIGETRTLLGETYSEPTLFGDDDATEKLLQVIKSEQVREYLKTRYDLANHYKIKPGYKYPNTLIAQKMKKYIRSSKSSYGSVEIRVRDHDRQLACDMANDMAAKADGIFNDLQRSAALAMLSEIDGIYETQLKLVKQYEDSLSILPGLINSQSKTLSGSLYKEYYNETVTGKSEVVKNLKKNLAPGEIDMVTYLRLFTLLEKETENLTLIRSRYIEAQALSRQNLPYTLVVDRATAAEKKAYPKRSIIVVGSTAMILLLVAIVLFIKEGVKLHRTDDR